MPSSKAFSMWLALPFLPLLAGAAPLQSIPNCAKGLNGKVPSWAPSTFNFSGNVQTYYVAAEQVTWDYAPSGWDNWLGVPLVDSPRAKAAGILKSTGSLGGTVWEKALYRGYTDSSFKTKSNQDPTQGIQGPTIRGEVGDLIQILFVNKLKKNYASMHSMGLTYNKGDEGSIYPNTVTGQSKPAMEQEALAPGECVVYNWLVTSTDAPEPGKVSIARSYHSYVDLEADTNAGLMGPIIVYESGQMKKTMESTREFPLLYMIFDETLSFLAGTNSKKYGGPGGHTKQLVMPHNGNETIWKPQLVNMPTVALTSAQGPQFNSINGYVFENGNPFEMCQYDKVIWYLQAYGTDSHGMHLHGNNLLYQDTYVATKNVQDGEQFQLQMTPEEPGVWELLCHVNDHQNGGMVHNYQVHPQKKCPLTKLQK